MKPMKKITRQQWQKRRMEIFARDSWKCIVCGRTYEEAQLQVHHKIYTPHTSIWDYPDDLLLTLCKGCHAREHGLIMPQSGWEYVGYNDLGDLVGECDVCHAQLRYEHLISHPDWGHLTVGESCANRLTGSEEASEYEKDRRQKAEKLARFIGSKRWREKKNGHFIEQNGFGIEIWNNGNHFRLVIRFYDQKRCEWIPLNSKHKYATLEKAKIQAYQVISSGKLDEYIKKHFG